MSPISIFDVLGLNVVGSSSSHTAGTCPTGLMTQKLLGGPAWEVEFILYGSLVKIYKGHGTNRALPGEVMGFPTDDVHILNTYDLADKQNTTWTFICNEIETGFHPNTADIHTTGVSEKTVSLRDESTGNGKTRTVRINGIEVDFPDEHNTLITAHRDCIGMTAYITSCSNRGKVDAVFTKLFREARGDRAHNVVEFGGSLPEATQQRIKENQDAGNVMLTQIRGVG